MHVFIYMHTFLQVKQKLSPLISDTLTVQASTPTGDTAGDTTGDTSGDTQIQGRGLGRGGESRNDNGGGGGREAGMESQAILQHVRLRVPRFAKDAIR